MVTAAWDTSNLVALYRDGLQCTSCCYEGYEPGLCCPGFGENSTPSQYTVLIEGVQDCPVPGASILNGLWTLNLNECEETPWPQEPSCGWSYEDSNVMMQFTRIHTGCALISFVASWKDGESWRAGFSHILSYTEATGFCATFTNEYINCMSPKYGKFGTAKVWPLAWPQWDVDAIYQTNDRTFNDGEIYDCTLGHVANPDREPGTGVDWPSFWAVADPCGDENVGCP